MTAIQRHFFGPQLLDYNDNDLQQSKTKGVQVSYFIINSYHKLNIFEFFVGIWEMIDVTGNTKQLLSAILPWLSNPTHGINLVGFAGLISQEHKHTFAYALQY